MSTTTERISVNDVHPGQKSPYFVSYQTPRGTVRASHFQTKKDQNRFILHMPNTWVIVDSND